MSDGSNMGLFGSKDRNQEQKEKSSKDSSPARYAPYGVDSDTETYDTEALSMMDINDIIGVQSGEQVGESTLESEIAALSQIITDSKVELTLQSKDLNPVIQQQTSSKIANLTSSTLHISSIDNTSESSIVSEKCTDSICELQEEMSDLTCENETRTEPSVIAEMSASENADVDFKRDEAFDVKTSEIVINTSTMGTVRDEQQVDIVFPMGHEMSDAKKTADETVDNIIDSQNETKSGLKPVVIACGNISKSLQLIGEAYNSEDSEETDMNDNDSPKETPSLSTHRETSSSDVSAKQHKEDSCEITDILEQSTEISSKLNDTSVAISEELNAKVETVIDSKLDLDKIESENSNQSEMLQQVLEVQEDVDDTASTKVSECVDIETLTRTQQNENNTEIEMNTTERTALEHQSSNETLKETADTIVDTSAILTMEITKNIEQREENTEIESSTLALGSETEEQDLAISSEKELPNTKEANEHSCPAVDANVLECEDRDIVSVNKIQESTLTKTSDKELSMTDATNKNNNSQEVDVTFIQKDLEKTVVTSDNQDSADVVETKKETSVLMDTNVLQTASDTTNKDLILNEDISRNRPDAEEKNITDVPAGSHLLSEENSDLSSKNLIIQSDSTSDGNNSEDTNVCTQDVLETLTSVKHEKSIDQFPSVLLEKSEINNTTSSKFEELHSILISHEDSSSLENVSKSEVEEIENVERKILEAASLSVNKDQNKTALIENKPVQMSNQSESSVLKQDNSSIKVESKLSLENVTSSNILLENDTNSSLTENLIAPENDVTDYICNIVRKEDKVAENITAEISLNETAIKISDLDEDKVKEIEKITEKEKKVNEINLVSESVIPEDVQANSENINLQDDEKTKPCERIAKIPMESKNSIDVAPTVEENNMQPIIKESTDANLKEVQSNIDEISLSQKSSDEKMSTEKLIEKLPQDLANVDAPATVQTVDSLEGLLDITLMSDNENSSLKDMKTEDKTLMEEIVSKNIDMDLLLDQANQSEATMTQSSDYITNVIVSCLSNRDNETSETDINIPSNDKTTENKDTSLKVNEDMSAELVSETASNDKMEESLETDSNLQQNDLDVDFESSRLEAVDLEESETKLELPQDILEGVIPSESLSRHTDTPTVIENSQSSSEISELESAVKFLQESEEQTIDSLVLSPKMVESVVEDITKQANAELYVPDEIDNFTNAESELAHLRNADATDSISISEAEIISEAAKLENERKFATQMQNVPNIVVKDTEELNEETRMCLSDTTSVADNSLNAQTVEQSHKEKGAVPEIRSLSSEGILKACELIPRVSILEERLKEPPKIEIPVPDSSKVLESSISPNDSLLIPKDARAIAYSRMLESPKSADKVELKGADTPRKDFEKHSDLENVGSPRIILKIAKSAITDCSEPRSPKSPKIRSATNSPNPDDSPGQKLGKIKLKLSKGGHPSIISNENLDEVNQWHTTENTSSLSPIGMKIKLSKSGDASIVGIEKHESPDDSKEVKYKIEEPKRTDSPIGMKIKLSKSGDASIISDSKQQDTKEALTKHKEKLEMPQGSPKRTESPIGMKIKLSKTGDASIIQTDRQESLEEHKEVTQKRTDSPIGMKIKLSKTGDASIVSPDASEDLSTKTKEKQDHPELPKRTESPIGMKIKLSKCKGAASIISVDNTEDTKDKLEVPEPPKRTESPLGMKIKLSKTGDASIIHSEVTEDVKEMKHKDRSEILQDTVKTPESSGLKIKMKTGEAASLISPDVTEEQDVLQTFGLSTSSVPRIKVSKSGDMSVVSNKTELTEESRSRGEGQAEMPKRTESPLGMKIKLSKSGDASIVQSEIIAEEHQSKTTRADAEYSKGSDSSLGMKIKLFKTGDASVVETPSSGSSSEKKDKQQRRRDAADSPLEMKIKLSKTGHPTIVTCDSHGESTAQKGKDPAAVDPAINFSHRYMEHAAGHKESPLKIIKTSGHPSILQSNRSELTIEPVQMQNRKQQPTETAQQQIEISPKRKDVTISPIESKKSKLETQLSQILPEVTIQPVMCRDQKQQQQQQQQQQKLLFDPKTSLISRQQMNVINQEISITQVRSDNASDKFKDICKNSPGGLSDCEIIEHRPELIIVNENSNSSQDVVIIEEVSPNRADIKVPKKRGRPRRNPATVQQQQQPSAQMLIPRDPLALDDVQQVPPQQFEHRENERPKRTCRNQKSYAPPKRGRGGRGRGKRKLDNVEPQIGKKTRIEQDLSAIEASTMAVITIDETPVQQESLRKSSELYKALKQPPIDRKSSALGRKEAAKKDSKISNSEIAVLDPTSSLCTQEDPTKASNQSLLVSKADEQHKKPALEIVSERTQKSAVKQHAENKGKISDGIKEIPVPPGHSNWLTPTSKKQPDSTAIRGETVSTVQVIDEETRMSAESGSRSQTPARNIPAPTSETIINEESQGSVLSTATTESEKVKVKNRRMEINFDPDEGPFTVDKIAEYEWPLDRKGETFMIQEQISQYLGVKSFKRKYPDLKRRVVDMEERNYLRENGLVSEAMCDMGLTAVCSSEVLDVMCSDFPDQYEEYRKHMREKQVKEHSKKQKELTAAANAERNRIDLAEMAMQSAFTWNANLNKARKEQRKYCLDLQTFTIQQPQQKQQKIDSEHKVGHYPVALIPGQYTDYYREYTPAELRYYPLNTVLYGPTRPNERKSDSQSEGSQSDSDSESSSDDSSSSSSEGTQDTEGSQSTMDEVDMEISNAKDDTKLKCKMCLKVLNKHNKNEILIQCGTCNGNVHPSCIDLTLDMVPHIQSYAWQCTDCKTCAQCHDPADEDKMLFCDMCDRGYHIYCVGLRRVPQGRWHCQECAVCANCGSREPGGANSDRNSVAQWQHEYKKGEKNTRVYVSTLCVPCSKLWRKGRYCPHCSRCHTAQRLDLETNLVHCSACDKYLHLECVETKGVVVDKKNYLCDFCTPSTSQHVVKPLMSKVLKT
ncbi:uncharacterized protein LOC105828128 isoform X3 [Monomorium pharaonis]|uniref:uncharacterized protein LOC105828128 isoform X3 n=1 Tax=Monomorium pharaonis TaxID=307658 RepID=UPI00063F6227|nr:uncharacterized protein LOC105828128 isoform X3 [Monomorium pharaonis]